MKIYDGLCHGFSQEEYKDYHFSHFSMKIYNVGTSEIAMVLAKRTIQISHFFQENICCGYGGYTM